MEKLLELGFNFLMNKALNNGGQSKQGQTALHSAKSISQLMKGD